MKFKLYLSPYLIETKENKSKERNICLIKPHLILIRRIFKAKNIWLANSFPFSNKVSYLKSEIEEHYHSSCFEMLKVKEVRGFVITIKAQKRPRVLN